VGGDCACRICGGPGRPWLEKKGLPLLRCSRCGNGYLPDARVPDDLESLYSREYFEGGRETGYPAYLAEAPLLAANFERRLAWIEGLQGPGRLLDVGAAYGLFLKAARARGWDPVGVEIAPDCAEQARRIAEVPVQAGDFLEVPLEPGFDVITFFDVIEHMRRPADCLARAAGLLRPGGWVVVETGDLASPWARLLGRYWYFLDPPQHLAYFSARGLEASLRAAGLSGALRRCRPGRRVSLANMAFKLSQALPGALGRPLFPLRRLPGSLYLRFGDGLLVAAQRP